MNGTHFNSIELPIVSFPLPYRVLILAGLGILGWAMNLHGLDFLSIDVISAMELRTEGYLGRSPIPTHHRIGFAHRAETAALYNATYRVFAAYSVFCFLSWSFFEVSTGGDIFLLDSYGYIPAVTALSLLIVLICPFNVLFKSERDKFLQTIRRCLFSSMDAPVYFSDVVFADIGTSFAKVFGDVWLSLGMLLPGNSMLVPPTMHGWMRWVLPTVMSFPYAVRFRQCLIEYNLPSNESRRPLYNALKYATSFPVIYLSAAQRLVVIDLVKVKGDGVIDEPWHGEHHLFRLWLLAAAVNSIYSFWWDVTNDWGLEMFKLNSPELQQSIQRRPSPPRRLMLPHLHSGTPLISRESLDSEVSEDNTSSITLNDPPNPRQHRRPKYPWGLRQTLLYPLPVYPLLVFFNFILRMAWSIKLSSHLYSERDGSVAFFWLEIAEMARRWLWVFIRVEWEVIKKSREGNPKGRFEDENDLRYEMLPTTPDGLLVQS
ncbi:EXS family-domain-containing protein [Crucibulum laeve]|uniref:EXS family-domain-containing protein n=1 Tax=Crucibulum laeve TaxID=68775 RepID=A0A5C3MG66_9AGAR|nr:EXS family-domain-containing protein [Crucibulum laeve]